MSSPTSSTGPLPADAPGPSGAGLTDALGRPIGPDGLTAAERARIPRSSHLILIAVMVAFLSGAMTFTLQASWEWWVLPVGAALVAAVLTRQRVTARRRQLADLPGQPR